jgi:hypothetical protein
MLLKPTDIKGFEDLGLSISELGVDVYLRVSD